MPLVAMAGAAAADAAAEEADAADAAGVAGARSGVAADMTVVFAGCGGCAVAVGATPAGILIVGMPMIVDERGG